MVKEDIDIENMLIWVYQKQKADIIAGRAVGLLDIEASAAGIRRMKISGDGCAAVARSEALGVRVDSFGRDRGDLHVDAEHVHDLLEQFPAALRHLIICHAKAGTRPDPMIGAQPRMVPVTNKRGKITKIWNKNRNWIGCEVRPVNRQETIDFARETYRSWHRGVNLVAEKLQLNSPILIRYAPTKTKAPGEPWFGER